MFLSLNGLNMFDFDQTEMIVIQCLTCLCFNEVERVSLIILNRGRRKRTCARVGYFAGEDWGEVVRAHTIKVAELLNCGGRFCKPK